MARTGLRPLLIVTHRWLGVPLAVLVFGWFVSGIVLVFHPFPEVTPAERLSRASRLDPARVRVSPGEALNAARLDSAPDRIRLATVDRRPAYVIEASGQTTTVFADDGARRDRIDAAAVARAAEDWSGQPATAARQDTVTDVDQWTVGGGLRRRLPLARFSWPDGTQVYVDPATGEVAQATTARSRRWAWLGAIPHWLYFLPLRRHQATWSSVVIWTSALTAVAAVLGVALAAWAWSPGRRYRRARRPARQPYAGWGWWHGALRLVFGAGVVTWAFSGLLSMGPFALLDRLAAGGAPGHPGTATVTATEIAGALRGPHPPPSAYAALWETVTREADSAVREVEFISFDGDPALVLRDADGRTRVVSSSSSVLPTLDAARSVALLRDRFGTQLADVTLLREYDAYYRDRRGRRPLPVLRLDVRDTVATRLYVDLASARAVGTYSRRDWVDRWLYHGLHSLDLPWLASRPTAWHIVTIGLLLGGVAVSLTSLVLAWRALGRRLLGH